MPRLPLPRPLLENLHAAPQAYVVGGTVRDLLMERHPTDIDIAVDGDAALFAGAIADRLRGRVIPMGKPGLITHRVTGRGLLIDVTGIEAVRTAHGAMVAGSVMEKVAGQSQGDIPRYFD